MSFDEARQMFKLEVLGIPFILFLGSALHFTFSLSGGNSLVAVFSAVNESVWEHLKLGFWPALLYALIEYAYLKERPENFFPGKAAGIYLIPTAIVALYYSYRVFYEENLTLDILIFLVAVVAGQYTSYKLITSRKSFKRYMKASLAAIALLAVLFVIFTFHPPKNPLFQDPVTGGYGFR